MKLRVSEIISLIIILLISGISWYLYPQLPETVASHWNAAGEVNGYMSRFWGAFLMPIIAAVLLLIFLVIPRIDPKAKNIEKFRNYYDGLIILMLLFLSYLHALTLAWNFGYEFSMTGLLAPAFGILFFYIGVLIRHAEMNWTVGIRTPWTLSSEKVWKDTHARGSKLFMASGVIALLGIFAPAYAIWLILIPVVISAVYLFVYSYILYSREIKSRQL